MDRLGAATYCSGRKIFFLARKKNGVGEIKISVYQEKGDGRC